MGSMSRARSGVPWERGGPRLAPPAGAVASMRRLGCPPLWFDPGNRTVLSVQKPWPDGCVSTEAGGPRPTRGALAPLVALATCLAADVVPGRPSRAVLSSSRPAASTLDCRHRCAGRHRPSRLLEWPSGRSPGAVSSTTTPTPSGCATPTRSRRLTGSRACVGDHLHPVTGGTYDSRWRRLGSPQSSPEVPAETQEGPAGTGTGWGHSGRIGVRGPETFGGGRREPGVPVWPLEVPVQERGRPPPRPVGISGQARSVTAGAGLAFRGRLAGAPRPLRAAGIARPGNGQAGQPRAEGPKGRVDVGPGPYGDRLPAVGSSPSTCKAPLGHPLGPGEGGQFRGLRGAEQQDG